MNHLKSLLTAILPALFIAGIVGAATTLSQNIVTEGDLTVGGSVGIGTVAPTEILHLQNSDTDIIQEENVDSSSSPSHFLYKSRGSALSKSIVQNGDELGFVTWRGFDGSNYVSGGAIGTYVDGAPGTGDMPGRLIFMTTPDGSSTVLERMRIDSSGRVGIGTASPTTALTVEGGGTIDGFANAIARFTANDLGGVIIGSITGNTAYIGSNTASSNGLRLFTNGSTAAPVIQLTNAGDVGIGTNNPGSKLDVAGDVNATGSYLGDGSQLTGIPVFVGENLVSYWKFEDTLLDAGLTQDLSLQTGTETYVDSPFGKALDFDGSTILEASDAPYDFTETDTFSIEMWIKSSDTEVSGLFFKGNLTGSANYYSIIGDGAISDDTVIFQLGGSSGSNQFQTSFENIIVRDGNWHHLVFTYDGSNSPNGMKFYLDNLEISSTISIDNSPISNITNSSNLTISSRLNNTAGRELTGQLSHVRIYSSELTAKQVETLFQMR